jgi:hypothetical protein
MNLQFIAICGVSVAIALLTVYGLSPLFWDAAGYVESILTCVGNLSLCS